MSIQPRTTVPEILSSGAPEDRASVAGASNQPPAGESVQSAAAPVNNAVRIGYAFRLPNANRYRAGQRQLRAALVRDKSAHVRALFCAPPVPFASSARRFYERLVAPPGASSSIDCEDRDRDAAEVQSS